MLALAHLQFSLEFSSCKVSQQVVNTTASGGDANMHCFFRALDTPNTQRRGQSSEYAVDSGP